MSRCDSSEQSSSIYKAPIDDNRNLHVTQPCLFKVRPRLGGFQRRFNTKSIQSRDSLEKFRHLIPKDSYIKIKEQLEDKLQLNNTCPDFSQIRDPSSRDHTIRVCSLVISTVMMLAQGSYHNISIEHVKLTRHYLQCLQQTNNCPLNTQRLLDFLSCLENQEAIGTSHMIDPSEDDNEEIIVKGLLRQSIV